MIYKYSVRYVPKINWKRRDFSALGKVFKKINSILQNWYRKINELFVTTFIFNLKRFKILRKFSRKVEKIQIKLKKKLGIS